MACNKSESVEEEEEGPVAQLQGRALLPGAGAGHERPADWQLHDHGCHLGPCLQPLALGQCRWTDSSSALQLPAASIDQA